MSGDRVTIDFTAEQKFVLDGILGLLHRVLSPLRGTARNSCGSQRRTSRC